MRISECITILRSKPFSLFKQKHIYGFHTRGKARLVGMGERFANAIIIMVQVGDKFQVNFCISARLINDKMLEWSSDILLINRIFNGYCCIFYS